jgi:hypothetical protein
MLSREGRRRSRAEIAATLAIPTRACVERLVTNRPRGTARPRDGNGGTGGWRARGSPSKPATLINAGTQARAIVCGLPGPSLAPGDRFPRPGHGRPHPRGTRRLPKPPARASPAMIGKSWNFRSGTQAPAKDIVPLRKSWRCPNADHAPGNTATARHRMTYAFPSGDLLFQSYSTRRNSSLTSLAHDPDEGDGLFRMMRFCRVG